MPRSGPMRIALAVLAGAAASFFSAAMADMPPEPVERYLAAMALIGLVLVGAAIAVVKWRRLEVGIWLLIALAVVSFLVSEVLVQSVYTKKSPVSGSAKDVAPHQGSRFP